MNFLSTTIFKYVSHGFLADCLAWPWTKRKYERYAKNYHFMTLKIRYSKFATGTLCCFLILWEMVDLKVNMPRSQLVHRLTGLTVLASGLFGNRPFLIVRL